jgi:AcrR family transcriptional regulator
MARLTRAESQQRTRDKLLATAKAAFLRDGYAATSLDKIAEMAGFSKGAVYSNFKNKDELCLLVLDVIRNERAAALGQAIAGQSSLEDRLAAFQKWAEKNIGDRAWTALEVEFGVHAARDPELSRALASRARGIRDVAAIAVATYMKELGPGVTLPMSPEDVAVALLSLGVGLGMQRAIDPTMPVRVLSDLLRLLAKRKRRTMAR